MAQPWYDTDERAFREWYSSHYGPSVKQDERPRAMDGVNTKTAAPVGMNELLGMLGQYGEQDKKEANRQALMALGFGLMGGRKGQEFATLGRAGLGAMDQRSMAMANAQAQRQGQFQNALAMLKFQQAQQQAQAQEAQAREMAGAFQGGPQLQNMGPGGPTPANAEAIAAPSLIEQYRKASVVAAKSGNSEAAKRFADIANGMEAEFSTTPQTMREPGGDLASVLIGRRGETKKLPYLPAEKLHFANTGGLAGVGLNPFTGKPESSGLPVTMDPAQSDASKRGWAGLAQAERHFKEGKAGGGKPQWDSTTGQFVFAPTGPGDTGRAVTPAGYERQDKPLTESQSKATAFANQMSNATEVIEELDKKGFTGKGKWQQGGLSMAGTEGVPYVPGSAAVPRMFASDEAQKFDQATLQWSEAALRFQTGANAPKEEVIRNRNTYFPTPGDSAARVEQKRMARANMEKSIRMAAGQGVKQLPELPGKESAKQVVRRGTAPNGKRVVQYADGTIKEE